MKAINHQNHLSDENIALYVDALRLDKTDELSPEILEHINSCKSCHRQAIDLYSMLGEVDYAGVGPHPTLEKKAAKVLSLPRLLMRMAAAIALLLVALYFFNRNADLNNPGDIVKEDTTIENTNVAEEKVKAPEEKTPKQDYTLQPEKEDVVVKDAPVKVAPQKKEIPQPKSIIPTSPENNRQLFAANFTPSEEWDDMVNENVRSADFEVLQPKIGKFFKQNLTIEFQWEGNVETRYLVVMNNKGDEIQKAKVISNTFVLETKLDPGLYYWKLDSDDDLLHVGKFTVKLSE